MFGTNQPFMNLFKHLWKNILPQKKKQQDM